MRSVQRGWRARQLADEGTAVFTQLGAFSYPNWVVRLLRLGTRADLIANRIPQHSGSLLRGPVFEHACTAPEDLLAWMILNPDRLDWSGLDSVTSGATREHRTKLRDRDPETQETALESLTTRGCRAGQHQWHVLEGTTYVDCALFFDHVTVFIEGKRTKPKLTKRVSWLAERDQIARNLDCLRVEPTRASAWFALLVIDGEVLSTVADARALDDGGATAIRGSLPHLNDDQVDELYGHYIGFTTWSEIVRAFSLELQ